MYACVNSVSFNLHKLIIYVIRYSGQACDCVISALRQKLDIWCHVTHNAQVEVVNTGLNPDMSPFV